MRRIAWMLLLATPCFAQNWSGVCAPTRCYDWQDYAGIPGDSVPSASWPQCGATIAAYGSSGSPGSPSTIINALKRTGSGYTGCSANSYIQMAAGDFYLSDAIFVSGVNGTELRGAGAGQTRIHFPSGVTTVCQGGGTCLVGFQSSDQTYPTQPPANIYNWTAGYAQGATQVTLSSGSNIVANKTGLVLDQCDIGYTGVPCTGASTDNGNFFPCSDQYNATGPTGCSVSGPDTGFARPHRFQWEMALVTACSPSCGNSGSTVVTINNPLKHPNWASAQSPQAYLIQTGNNNGVQNLSLDGSTATAASGVAFQNLFNFWAVGVAVLHQYNIGIWPYDSINGVVESNYVPDAGQDLTYSDPTGIKFNGDNNLIVNNIVQAVRPSILEEGPGSGNVIAYNYLVNQYTASDFMFDGIEEHSEGDDYNLWEGNVVSQTQQDQIHGSHLMETYHRNLFTGWESCANGQCGANIKDSNTTAAVDPSYARYSNYFGNILGTPTYTTIYQSVNQAEYIVTHYAFVIGSGNNGASPAVPADSVVGTTLTRWGNWDVANGATLFCTAVSTPIPACQADERGDGAPVYPALSSPSTTLPASFFYSSRPSWWPASIPFPAIGPDVTGGNVGVCSGTLNTSGHFSGVPATSSSQCTGTSLTASQWGGHVNATPAMNCALNVMGMPPDGTGGALTFNAADCYASIQPPDAMTGTVSLGGTQY